MRIKLLPIVEITHAKQVSQDMSVFAADFIHASIERRRLKAASSDSTLSSTIVFNVLVARSFPTIYYRVINDQVQISDDHYRLYTLFQKHRYIIFTLLMENEEAYQFSVPNGTTHHHTFSCKNSYPRS